MTALFVLNACAFSSASRPSMEDVCDLATYFLGGGTAFEPPLAAAVKMLEEESYRDGDIVFITDGFSDVSDEFLERYNAAKERRRFNTFSILIDARDLWEGRDMQRSATQKFSDRIVVSESLIDAERGNFPDDVRVARDLYSLF